jgi:hypothetical protein
VSGHPRFGVDAGASPGADAPAPDEEEQPEPDRDTRSLVEMDFLADPERLARLDLTVLDG